MKAIIQKKRPGEKGVIVLREENGKESVITVDTIEAIVGNDFYEGEVAIDVWKLDRYYMVARDMERMLNLFIKLQEKCEKYPPSL